MLIHSLPRKSGKKLPCDVFNTFAAHASLFFYGSNTDYWAKDGDNHGCVLVTLSVIFLITNLMRNPMKNCYMSLSHSVPISRVLGDSLVLFSIKMFGLFAHDQELNQDYTHSLSSG